MLYAELVAFIISGGICSLISLVHLAGDFIMIDESMKGRRAGVILEGISVLSSLHNPFIQLIILLKFFYHSK